MSFKAASTPRSGYDYKEIVRLLFSPDVLLPPLAVIYTADVADAERAGADHIILMLSGLARDKGKTHGYHEREIKIPLAIARRLAFDTYDDYLRAWHARTA